MKKLNFSLLILIFLILILLSACQTHFPIISEDIESTKIQDADKVIICEEKNTLVDSAIVKAEVKADYLLYANKMIDAMAQSDVVKKNTLNARIRLSLSPIALDNNFRLNMGKLNQAIKNRILRSGLFILVDHAADFSLSGEIAAIKKRQENCYRNNAQFTLTLKESRSDKIRWSQTRYLN